MLYAIRIAMVVVKLKVAMLQRVEVVSQAASLSLDVTHSLTSMPDIVMALTDHKCVLNAKHDRFSFRTSEYNPLDIRSNIL